MHRSALASLFTGLALPAFVACSSDDAPAPPVVIIADAGFANPAPDAGPVVEPNLCDDLGLARLPFQTGATTFNFGDVAGDFSVAQIEGPTNVVASWSLQDRWTGCESYTFITYIPTNGNYEDVLWNSSPLPLVSNTDVRAHFFFLVIDNNQDNRISKLLEMKARLDPILEQRFQGDELAAHQARFHYVIDSPEEVPGSVGSFLTDYFAYYQDPANIVDIGANRQPQPPPLPFAFAIDRDQRWDSVGNLNETVGGPPSLEMTSYAAPFYDHKANLRDALATEAGVDTVMLLEGDVTDRIFTEDVTLPSAAQMAGYDTAEFDISVTCKERNVFACSEWDRIARIELCRNDDCSERTELSRWITPYWRRGNRRWITDASSLLAFIGEGGPQKFRIVFGPTWERATVRTVRVALRLSNQGKGMRSVTATTAFRGGQFNDEYNLNHSTPRVFTPPASAKKVELVVILSGHGQQPNTNCAEWCDHRHRFSVNGTQLAEIRHEGQVGSRNGCGPASAQGVPPGQFGNWAPERAYWCPGLPVEHIVFDLTDQVTLGQANSLTYEANLAGAPPSGGGNIDMNSYLVWYE